ncbi:MAG: ATP-binding protein, partial [Aliidongia sp.]
APADARDLILRPEDRDKPLPPPIRRPPPAADADALFVRPPRFDAEVPAPAAHGQAFDAIIREVLTEVETADRSIAVLYQEFLVRCRRHGLRGEAVNLPGFRRRLAACRAGADNAAEANPEWDQAAAIAAGLPDDIQGVFLLLARAASAGAPCPADASLARIYGSRSASRVRSVLSYIEQRGLIATSRVVGGWRVVTLPTLGWTTAPGDPAGPEQDEPNDGILL